LPPAFIATLPPMHEASAEVGIDREHEAAALGGVGHALRDHARLGPDRRHRLGMAGDGDALDLGHRLELLGVDHRALPGQRDGAAGVAGAAPARDDGQAQFDATLDQDRHLGLGVRREHHERVFDAPVGGVRHVRDARHAVELDVVLARVAAQQALGARPQCGRLGEGGVEAPHGSLGRQQQLAHEAVALRVAARVAALFNFVQAMVQGFHQQLAPLGVVQQVVLQVGIALDDPDIAQHLVQHARGAAGAALLAQPVQDFPGAQAQEPDHDLAVRERGVVVGDLAQAGRIAIHRGHQLFERRWRVHLVSATSAKQVRLG
jgi:hypothetical protein